jgi:aspartyl-tRNA(Asn)/glutamyl-tRNA(Gln) amidotransferase subunit A
VKSASVWRLAGHRADADGSGQDEARIATWVAVRVWSVNWDECGNASQSHGAARSLSAAFRKGLEVAGGSRRATHWKCIRERPPRLGVSVRTRAAASCPEGDAAVRREQQWRIVQTSSIEMTISSRARAGLRGRRVESQVEVRGDEGRRGTGIGCERVAGMSMREHNWTASDLLAHLQAREISAVEVVRGALDAIHHQDGQIGAFLSVQSEAALVQAAEIDRRRLAGESVGVLAGVPIAVKDIFCTQGVATTCGSKMLETFVPPYDAEVIRRLRAADAIVIGKTNLDEFAMGGSTEHSALGKTVNPWDIRRTPGGSSGGSAACIAAGMVPLAVGTDTGGSIRQPASFCGITGLKPSYGRVSRWGMIAFASSLDQAGPMARTAADAALLLQVLAGHDPRDATSAPYPVPSYRDPLARSVKGLRLGLVKEHFASGLDPQVARGVEAAIEVYRSLGAEIHEVELPHAKYGIAVYYILAPCEASSNLARYDGAHYGYRTNEIEMMAEWNRERKQLRERKDQAGLETLDNPLVRMYCKTRAEGLGDEVKLRVMLGTYALSAGYYDAYYLKALRVRRLIREDYERVFQHVDLVIGPTTPTPAFRLGALSDDPLAMYLQDLFTVNANLAGIAGISIPCGMTDEGLPIGLQLQAPAFEEARLLWAADQFQQVTEWHQRRPTPWMP